MNIKELPLAFLKNEEKDLFVKDFIVSLFENEFNSSCELKFNQWKDMGKTLSLLVVQSPDKVGVKNVIFTSSSSAKNATFDMKKIYNFSDETDFFRAIMCNFTSFSFVQSFDWSCGNLEAPLYKNTKEIVEFLYELEKVGGFVEFESTDHSFFENVPNDVVRRNSMSMDEINSMIEKEKNMHGVNFDFMIDSIVSLSTDYNTASHFEELKEIIANAMYDINEGNDKLKDKYNFGVIYNDIDHNFKYGDAAFLFKGKDGNIIALIELRVSRYEPNYTISIFEDENFDMAVKEVFEIMDVSEEIEKLKENYCLDNIKKVKLSDFTDNPLKFLGKIDNTIYSK